MQIEDLKVGQKVRVKIRGTVDRMTLTAVRIRGVDNDSWVPKATVVGGLGGDLSEEKLITIVGTVRKVGKRGSLSLMAGTITRQYASISSTQIEGVEVL